MKVAPLVVLTIWLVVVNFSSTACWPIRIVSVLGAVGWCCLAEASRRRKKSFLDMERGLAPVKTVEPLNFDIRIDRDQ